jgi:hypothetical protein
MLNKFSKSALILAMVGSSLLFSPVQRTVQAADFTASIDIDTSSVISYNPDFRGVNNEPERTALKFNDPELIQAAIDYGRIGFVRWPGGTPTNAFSLEAWHYRFGIYRSSSDGAKTLLQSAVLQAVPNRQGLRAYIRLSWVSAANRRQGGHYGQCAAVQSGASKRFGQIFA